MPSPENFNQYLLPTDYPATRDELVSHARDRGAPQDVIASLQTLPEKEYRREMDIYDAVLEQNPGKAGSPIGTTEAGPGTSGKPER